MRILRWITVRLLAFGLGLFLAVLSICAIIYATVANPGFVKSTLDTSGLYDNFVDSGLKLASANLNGDDSEITQTIAGLTPVVKQVITPGVLQANTEAMVDGVGEWLKGKTPLPVFSIDIKAIRIDLNTALADYLKQRLETLPNCPTYAELESLEIVSTACQPRAAVGESAFLTAANDFTAEMPIFSQDKLTSEDLIKDASSPAWQAIPNAYKWVALAPYIAGGIVLLCAGLIVVVSQNRARSIRKIGHIFLSNAIVLLIAGGVIILFLGRGEINFIGGGSIEQIAFAKEIIEPLVHALAKVFGSWLLYFGVGYGLVAIICYFVARGLNHHKTKGADGDDKGEANQAPAPDSYVDKLAAETAEEPAVEDVEPQTTPPASEDKDFKEISSDEPTVPGPPAPQRPPRLIQ
jgi:hypothetical protein